MGVQCNAAGRVRARRGCAPGVLVRAALTRENAAAAVNRGRHGVPAIDPTTLSELTAVLRCLDCGGRSLAAEGDAVACRSCGRRLPIVDGVLHVTSGDEDPAIGKERAAVLDIDRAAVPSSATDFVFADLLQTDGPLRKAFVSLPYDDGSAFFRDNEYFRNVSGFADSFDFVVNRLELPAGSRVLDVGADLTWSTSRLAERGWRPVGIDINHHLVAAQVLRPLRGPYAVVTVDMHAPAFADGVFDAVTAFNALHHTHRIEALIGNLSRVLRPGGRLGFIEPYWVHEYTRDAFGVSQIEMGINENTHRLEEWHHILVNAGLEPIAFNAGTSFDALYEKRSAGAPRRLPTVAEAHADLFASYYRSEVTAAPVIAASVSRGSVIALPLVVHNRSIGGWCSESQLPVLASYHLYKVEAAGGRRLERFDNVRTALPGTLESGATTEMPLRIDAPIEPGDYLLEVDLVHEGVSWFAERGGKTATIAMRVA